MSYVGEALSALGWLPRMYAWIRGRIDPARAQAQRLIKAFEAHGILRQQIPRLLPVDLKLPNAAFSTPDRLKEKLTPELLDWAAEYLQLERGWFDGATDMPHRVVDFYKTPGHYLEWFEQRQVLVLDTTCYLMVWKPAGHGVWSDGGGPLCLVYEEVGAGLDGSEFSRYWLLSDEWSLGHSPCLENMIAVVALARASGIAVLGQDIPLEQLRLLILGKRLVPEVHKSRRDIWYPEDLIKPLPGQDTEWRQALWKGAQGYLAADGVLTKPTKRAADRSEL